MANPEPGSYLFLLFGAELDRWVVQEPLYLYSQK